MYILKTEGYFDSAHFLWKYDGKCKNIHGHRWKVEIMVSSESLCDEGQCRGMVVDFGDLKEDLEKLVNELDHSFIIEKNSLKKETIEVLESEGFELKVVDFRPTAENFAKYFYDKMTELGYKVNMATIYETPNNCASYAE